MSNQESIELESFIDGRTEQNRSETKSTSRNVSKIITITIVIILLLIFTLGGIRVATGMFVFPEKISSTPAPASANQRISACNKRVIGYYSATETSEITSSQIFKLTHAVFAFVYMTSEGILTFIDQYEMDRFSKLKEVVRNGKYKVKLLFSIGGKDNSRNFSTVISSEKRIQTFIKSILDFLKDHNLNGVDLFWKWPEEKEKMKYSKFIQRLKKEE